MNFFSDLWTVKLGDWGRGLVIAVLTTPLTIIYNSVTATPMSLTFDWKAILGAALAGGIGYILKNLLTGNGGVLLKNGVKVLAYLIIPLMLLGSMSTQGCRHTAGVVTSGVPAATQSSMVYDQALTAYLNAWDSYHTVWIALPPTDPRKAAWTKTYHPKFLSAAIALEAWANNPGSSNNAVAANAAIDQVTAVLIELAIPVTKGGK